jgi:DNA polymerase
VVTIAASDYPSWRSAARRLLAAGVRPEAVIWVGDSRQAGLPFPGFENAKHEPSAAAQHVPRAFMTLAETAACHRNPRRWEALYRLLWRVADEGRHLLEQDTDGDVRIVMDLAAQVRRDEHKMHAFVRFSPVRGLDGTRYVAWYEPDHLIVQRAAPFFADRFASMRWSILTPDLCAHWDGCELTFSDGVDAPTARDHGDVGDLWRVYYEAIFNPARVNPRAMRREMPVKGWRNLPEATLIPQLVSTAAARTRRLGEVRTSPTARAFVPDGADLSALRMAASSCRGCPLYAAATQVVFGEGPADAELVLIGEQPGDAEDLAGRPFVGPAGAVLDAALAAAGLQRGRVYLTNAVKHFSFEPRGKRRIHQTPSLSETQACRPWLETELQRIRPTTAIAMGSTAARALLGPQARVMALRGRVLEGLAWAPRVIVTVHPSAVLRSRDEGERYFAMLVADLSLAGAPSKAEPDDGRQS